MQLVPIRDQRDAVCFKGAKEIIDAHRFDPRQ
jgi:hypothetical protein